MKRTAAPWVFFTRPSASRTDENGAAKLPAILRRTKASHDANTGCASLGARLAARAAAVRRRATAATQSSLCCGRHSLPRQIHRVDRVLGDQARLCEGLFRNFLALRGFDRTLNRKFRHGHRLANDSRLNPAVIDKALGPDLHVR